MVVEQDEIILVRRRRGAIQLWCSGCQEHVSMLRVEDASALVGATARTIYRWVEAGKLHFAELEGSGAYLCSVTGRVRDECRRRGRDPRLSIEERYQTHEGW